MGITCKQAVDYISKNEEGKLSLRQKLQLWRHKAVCTMCRLFEKQNRLMDTVLSEENSKPRQPLDPLEKEAIIKKMTDH
jgi:hypothetical protein